VASGDFFIELEVCLLVFTPFVAITALGLAAAGWWAGISIFGGPPTQHMLDRRAGLLTAAFVVGTAGPLAGIAVASYTRQAAAGVIYGVVLAATLAITTLSHISRDATEDPLPTPRGPQVCQEHSGGDTRCPGG
jgi:hypothetical protein